MKNILLALALGLLSAIICSAQGVVDRKIAPQVVGADTSTISMKDSFEEYAYESFMKFYGRGIQEKLYIQTDKPYYSAGENIWFKGYVVNAITNVPMMLSNFIYVELINKNDSLVQRVKIKADDHGFHNSIPLAASLPQGEYVLRGYTQWMRNEDDKFFFRKELKIVNPIDDDVNSEISYSRDEQGNIVATIAMRDQRRAPIVSRRFVCTLNVNGRQRRDNVRTDDRGVFTVTFALPQKGSTINIASDEPGNNLDRTIFLPLFADDFDVQFFPESGHLLGGLAQTVAFKAVGSDGLSRNVTGQLFDAEGSMLAEFESAHKGMGQITIMAETGKKYYVMVKVSGGDGVKRFDFPQVEESGSALKVAQLRGRIYYQISTTPDVDPRSLGVCIHSKGKVIALYRVTSDKLAQAINTDNLQEGIAQIALIDINTAQIVAQRAFYVRHRGSAGATIEVPEQKCRKRESVNVALKITDDTGVPARGSFAVSVTDRSAVHLDTLADNVASYLHLSSDIRGYIEDPAAYFINNSAQTLANLDLLMLTQGWTRFDVGDLIRRTAAPNKFEYESCQTFSGEIKGFFGNAAKSPTILIFNPSTHYFDTYSLGKTNKFNIRTMDYPDSTSMILQAIGKSGSGRMLTLNLQPETFPSAKSYLRPLLAGSHELRLPQAFISQSQQKYYYDGGMRVINIEAVEVSHRKQESHSMFNMTPTHSIGGKEIERYAGRSLIDVLRMFPGVHVSGENISIRGSQDPPLTYIDDMATDINFALGISMMDVESVGIVTGPEANIYGLGASNGVILVRLKSGASASASVPSLPSMATIKRLGFKLPSAFFQPKYDVAANLNNKTPDLRTTLLWNPLVRTDSTGVAQITFYAADTPTIYDVVLEGVTEKGAVIRAVSTIKRED